MNRFEELKTLVLSLEDEFYKFYEKDNKAAQWWGCYILLPQRGIYLGSVQSSGNTT